jgi:hypothetical protein
MTHTRKLLTIITESAIEDEICTDLVELGATGYTITDARGAGERGVRDAGWSTSGNVRVEVICDAKAADRIAAFLQDRYFRNYAMIVFTADVDVLRSGKF